MGHSGFEAKLYGKIALKPLSFAAKPEHLLMMMTTLLHHVWGQDFPSLVSWPVLGEGSLKIGDPTGNLHS